MRAAFLAVIWRVTMAVDDHAITSTLATDWAAWHAICVSQLTRAGNGHACM